MLIGLGNVFDALFHHGQFINLPVSYAVISYLFWGFCAALPILLLRAYLKLPYLLVLVAILCFVPASGWDYQIIGTIGNFKFIFVYITFLLILYRLRIPHNSRRVIPVDIALLICGYTNVTIYPMLLVLLWPYRNDIKTLWKKPWELLKQNLGLASLVCLGAALIPQLIVIKLDGIPVIPGYLDGSFDNHRLVEILIHRPFLYAATYGLTKHFNDARAIIGFALFLAVTFLLRSRETIIAMLLGIGTIFVTTISFVINRPGVSQFFFGYKAGGPAQFFFTQNMIFYVLAVLLLASLASRIRFNWIKVTLVIVFAVCILGQLRSGSSFGDNDFMQRNVGTIYASAHTACNHTSTTSKVVSLRIYPSAAEMYNNVPKALVCTPSLSHYQTSEIDLGLTNSHATYFSLGAGSQYNFTQTFFSPQPMLNGIDLYISTFDTAIKSTYVLRLYDDSCRNRLREVILPASKLQDNQYADIFFNPIVNSANKIYCFSVSPTSSIISTPIAVWLSSTDYTKGQTTIAGKSVTTDIVFRPLYSPHVQ